MELFKDLGFDIKLFLAQVVNFLILFFIFKRFLYKPILDLLKTREDRIKKGLDDAEKAKVALERSGFEQESIIKAARIEAQKILSETKQVALETGKNIIEGSQSEARKMLAQAKNDAAAEMGKMEKRLEDMTLDLSRKILSNTIKTLFTEEERKKIEQRAISQLKEENK